MDTLFTKLLLLFNQIRSTDNTHINAFLKTVKKLFHFSGGRLHIISKSNRQLFDFLKEYRQHQIKLSPSYQTLSKSKNDIIVETWKQRLAYECMILFPHRVDIWIIKRMLLMRNERYKIAKMNTYNHWLFINNKQEIVHKDYPIRKTMNDRSPTQKYMKQLRSWVTYDPKSFPTTTCQIPPFKLSSWHLIYLAISFSTE